MNQIANNVQYSFLLTVKEGVTQHGTQYQIRCIYEHKLQRTSFNFCFGPFGGVKGISCLISMMAV